eukprot:UN28365
MENIRVEQKRTEIIEIEVADTSKEGGIPDRSDKGHLDILFKRLLTREAEGHGSIAFVKMHAFGYSNIVKVSYISDKLKTVIKMTYSNAVKATEDVFGINVHIAGHDPTDLTLEHFATNQILKAHIKLEKKDDE